MTMNGIIFCIITLISAPHTHRARVCVCVSVCGFATTIYININNNFKRCKLKLGIEPWPGMLTIAMHLNIYMYIYAYIQMNFFILQRLTAVWLNCVQVAAAISLLSDGSDVARLIKSNEIESKTIYMHTRNVKCVCSAQSHTHTHIPVHPYVVPI